MRLDTSSRRITLENFDDGGLASGPRRIEIHLPEGYGESRDCYPVVYFSDGGIVFSNSGPYSMDVDLAHDRLVQDGSISPVILVGITNTSSAGRARDLTPTEESGYPDFSETGGGLEGYYQFIAQRLKPSMDLQYRTQPEAASTGIAGASLGGLAAFLIAYEHPETFGMAGCMSSSWSWDHGYAFRRIESDGGAAKPIRIWVDGGGEEYEVWRDAAHAYDLLERQGWTPGENLAAFFDYAAAHEPAAQRDRMREMLSFLLRREPLKLVDYRLICASDPTRDVVRLHVGEQRIIAAEAWRENGLRLTVPHPNFTIADPDIVTFDEQDPLLLHGVSPGETILSSVYQGYTASLRVIVS
ncbi:hypothetical protein CCAX7_008030 [Capsulimonas corticalis]|uniref:Uncharacterized protein n=1 Tax=Capsulimonas corticalis TaxID=2219043 RepID=A0A402CTW0_9BACT|nr:hypothetical protein CCAX7_008030 [Capsulimonas corticalis]